MADRGLRRALGLSAVFHAVFLIAAALFFISERSKNLLGESGLPSKAGAGPVEVSIAPPPDEPPPPRATPKPTDRPKATPRPAPEATPEPTPEPRSTPEPTPPPEEAVKELEISKKATPTPKPKATPKPTDTPAPKATPKPTATPKPKATQTPKATPTPKATEAALSPSKSHDLVPPKDPPTRTTKTSTTKATEKAALSPSKSPGTTPGKSVEGKSSPAGAGMGSAKVGSNELTGLGLPDYYARQALQHIGRNFKVPDDDQRDKTAVVAFTIHRDGRLTSPRIKTSCGSSALDDLAIQAIKRTGKIAPLPDTVSMDSVDAEVAFNFLEGS